MFFCVNISDVLFDRFVLIIDYKKMFIFGRVRGKIFGLIDVDV